MTIRTEIAGAFGLLGVAAFLGALAYVGLLGGV